LPRECWAAIRLSATQDCWNQLSRGRRPWPSGPTRTPDLDSKAAALLHSLARNHALVDGNKRLALSAVIAFYGVNGRRLTFTNDETYDLIIDVATGRLDSVEEITRRLGTATEPR
jgi:prophage maintenance system killer protein